MALARPTIRCLLDELASGLTIAEQRAALLSGKLTDLGPISLSEIGHPLIVKAGELLHGRDPSELHEYKISAVTDHV